MAARSPRLLLFAGLYTGQYIGIGFISVTLVALLREQGASLAQLGMINLVMLPVSLKFLWMPLVDRYGRFKNSHYRSWMLPVQFLMMLCLLLAGMLHPHEKLALLWWLLLAFAVVVSTQDLALDGLATVSFDPQERGRVNSIQVGSGMVGNMMGGGLVLWLYPHIGWQGCLNVLAALMLVPWLQLWFFRESVQARTDTPSPKAGGI